MVPEVVAAALKEGVGLGLHHKNEVAVLPINQRLACSRGRFASLWGRKGSAMGGWWWAGMGEEGQVWVSRRCQVPTGREHRDSLLALACSAKAGTCPKKNDSLLDGVRTPLTLPPQTQVCAAGTAQQAQRGHPPSSKNVISCPSGMPGSMEMVSTSGSRSYFTLSQSSHTCSRKGRVPCLCACVH